MPVLPFEPPLRWVRLAFRQILVGTLVCASAGAAVGGAEQIDVAGTVVEAIDIGAVEARTGALLLSGQQGGNVPGALAWSLAGYAADGRAELPFTIEVEGRSLLEGSRGHRLVIGIYAYLVDDEGRVVAHMAQGVQLDRDPYADEIERSGLKFVGRFRAPPGSFALRVMVRNHTNNRFYLSWSFVDVPADGDASAVLLPPLFPDRPSQWVLVRQAGVQPAVAVDADLSIVPAARPTVPEHHRLAAYVPDLGWRATSEVAVRIVNSIGRTVAEPVVKAGPPSTDGFRQLDIAPLDLPPDTYTLITTVDDEQGGEVLRRAVRIEIIGEHQRHAWAARPVGPDQLEATSAAAPDDHTRLRKRELRSGYLEVLGSLASGDVYLAHRQLADLERRAATVGTPKALRTLAEVEQDVLDRVIATDPEGLASVALLHRQLERSYMARNEGMLAIHARSMAISTAEQLARNKPDDDFAAALMVNVAVELAQSHASGAARDLLQRVLRLDPDYAPALLSLGFSYERAAQHHEAASAYRQLTDVDPNLAEGRLRLAVNLVRTGRQGEGESIFLDLLSANPPAWVARLAAQELVRLLKHTERLSAAEGMARTALAAMPDDQRLWILLAAILDDLERYQESLDAMRELPPPTRGVSPRARYAEWPDLGPEASPQHLVEQAEASRSALGSALAKIRSR